MINRTHFYYVVGLLLVIVILQATVKFGANEKVVTYISFALTLTSLILALVSIIYSFYSNSSFTSNISTLNSASSKMSEASAKLTHVTETLNNKLDDIPALIKNIEIKIDTTHEYLRTSYSTVQETPNQQPAENLQKQFAETLVNYFVENTSISGLFLLYALTLSEAHQKPIHLVDFCEQIDLLNEQYCYGYIIGTVSFGLFNNKIEDGYFTISNMYHTIKSDIKSKIEIVADKDSKEKQNTFLKDQIVKIQEYFA